MPLAAEFLKNVSSGGWKYKIKVSERLNSGKGPLSGSQPELTHSERGVVMVFEVFETRFEFIASSESEGLAS